MTYLLSLSLVIGDILTHKLFFRPFCHLFILSSSLSPLSLFSFPPRMLCKDNGTLCMCVVFGFSQTTLLDLGNRGNNFLSFSPQNILWLDIVSVNAFYTTYFFSAIVSDWRKCLGMHQIFAFPYVACYVVHLNIVTGDIFCIASQYHYWRWTCTVFVLSGWNCYYLLCESPF